MNKTNSFLASARPKRQRIFYLFDFLRVVPTNLSTSLVINRSRIRWQSTQVDISHHVQHRQRGKNSLDGQRESHFQYGALLFDSRFDWFFHWSRWRGGSNCEIKKLLTHVASVNKRPIRLSTSRSCLSFQKWFNQTSVENAINLIFEGEKDGHVELEL